MTITTRDRRALGLLAVVVAVSAIYLAFTDDVPQTVAASGSIPMAEKRLARLRLVAATATAKQKHLERLSAEVAAREKGLIQAETPQQAQAQLLQILRRLCRAQAPPLEIRATEIGTVQPLGEDYGEAMVSVSFESRIEQLVQLLADLTAQTELLATSEVRVSAGDQRQKLLVVRLTVSGLVPKALAPVRKGPGGL